MKFKDSEDKPFVVVDVLVISLGEQLDGRESLDLDVLELVVGGVHLGDDNVLSVIELLTGLVQGRGELLAVTTPRDNPL